MNEKSAISDRKAAIVGAGPAGLMAAEILSGAGISVTVYDRMPSVGRKFLMAGRGGLNLTHSEDLDVFLTRYGTATQKLRSALEAFPPRALMAWSQTLEQPLFVGSSGRVFPKAMKASPLLRAWLSRLTAQNVQFRLRQEWQGWDASGALQFRGMGEATKADVTILALGGASWPKLGSDGGWAQFLPHVAPLRPANCGFTIAWSDIFRTRFAGTPLKNIAVSFAGKTVRGEATLTSYGIEGGAVYALSAEARDSIVAGKQTTLVIDMRPEMSTTQLAQKLARPRGGQTVTNFLRKTLHLSPAEINLLREANGAEFFGNPQSLAEKIKAIPLKLEAPQSLERAISTAGGVSFSALDENLMLRDRPGVFIAGEMLDWEAPTGGYLLQACFATGVAAAKGALAYLGR